MCRVASFALAIATLLSCGRSGTERRFTEMDYRKAVDAYVPVKLDADLSHLTENQRAMIPLLISAAQVMDDLFWRQAYGDRDALLSAIEDLDGKRFAEINYGPWDRLGDNEPFLSGVGPKPPGANFYPADMTKDEFEAASDSDPSLAGQYSLVRRDGSGQLVAEPYSVAFGDELARAAGFLREAADLAENPGFERYLRLRADAIETDDYRESDFAWMDMRDNALDVVIGPIESYEDRLFGTKTAFEGYVLVKDLEWSQRLSRYATMLPMLQDGLPVPDQYKTEEPGTDSELNAYDAIYYAGDCNAGAKTIAINLPNDEQVQLKKGSRRLQLRNSMRAKFDKIVLPIADELVAPDQRENVDFDSFFANTMFHEVAHGLGIKRTLDGTGTVREALLETASALEEAKADILGLHLVCRLIEMGEIPEARMERNFVTFTTGIFRSTRFGTSSAHGKANLISFNFFVREGAILRDSETGAYRVDVAKMRAAVDALAGEIIRIQGDGSHPRAVEFLNEMATPPAQLLEDQARLASAGIPVDVVFEPFSASDSDQ